MPTGASTPRSTGSAFGISDDCDNAAVECYCIRVCTIGQAVFPEVQHNYDYFVQLLLVQMDGNTIAFGLYDITLNGDGTRLLASNNFGENLAMSRPTGEFAASRGCVSDDHKCFKRQVCRCEYCEWQSDILS
jgi:hypothetical protein